MVSLSIIIPVYNSYNYLHQCLESVYKQDFDLLSYEVIAINDGSTDQSLNLLRDFDKKYANFILIDQENQGVSAARNAGLDIAKGNYITFLDSDDEIYPNVLKNTFDFAVRHSLDLLYLKVDYVDVNNKLIGEFVMENNELNIKDGYYHQRRGSVFSYYRRELIGNLRFDIEIPLAEDSLFNLMFHTRAKRCGYLHSPYYIYRTTPGSALNSNLRNNLKAFNGYLKFISVVKQFLVSENKNMTPDQVIYFDRPIFLIVKIALHNIMVNRSFKRYYILIHALRDMGYSRVIDKVSKEYPGFGSYWILFFLSVKLTIAKKSVLSGIRKL
jgi:glycosyltransferase involved in cell wall biosynthesis